MTRWARGFLFLTAAWATVATVVSLSSMARAHPHAWVDVSVKLTVDDSGRVTSTRQIWLFDDFYSAFAVDGLDGDGDGQPDMDKLDELTLNNLEALQEYQYFTDVRIGGERIAFDEATEMSSAMRGKRYEMSFTIPFRAQTVRWGGGLTYAIYDPTYYVEMMHAESDAAIGFAGSTDGCTYVLEEPNPEPAVVAFAAALDKTQSAGDGLGVLFAQKVTVTCSRKP